MFDIDELGRVAHEAYKKGGFEWNEGVPSASQITGEIKRQLIQVDHFREQPEFTSVETSCGCITVRCERENGSDEVNVYLDLGYDFVPEGRRIV